MAATENTPLHDDAAIQDGNISETTPKPSVDIDIFMDYFEGQCNALVAFSAMLICPALVIKTSPEISLSWPLRTVGLLVCDLNGLCLVISFFLRVSAWVAKRGGHTEQFAKDITNLRRGPARSHAAVVVRAPGWLMTATLATFLVEMIGYFYLWNPPATASPKAPMHAGEDMLYQVLLITFSLFATQSIIIASKLGKPPAPAPNPEVADVQEKV
ncbi:uncharacterized protein PHACADRAFT_252564 [Phanerochaete carnosa HHB-10118-sp]|uniref:Uncharacterized protein n=1 Tax=Phanerochaete carnosa (strain HHB-10118-sp) TaxID=650164 RepID=K5WGX9_PHACS|nr:uncharacterized protein PHACADRAFT_252564 [Phanerochaete carnosa HHB-10118-sp]EKM58329.1 hypothetical protein PHACADRAFT_252564 [Phanerochaete carnosa HHB-10118-sp]